MKTNEQGRQALSYSKKYYLCSRFDFQKGKRMSIAAIVWNFDPVALRLGSLELRWYSLLFACAFVAGYLILKKVVFEKENVPAYLLDKLAIYVFFGVLIGARLGHCLFYEPSYYLSHPIEMLLPVEIDSEGWHFTGYQGLASHGGAIGILIAVWLYSRSTKLPMLWVLDRLVLIIALAGLFIRLGNLANSEIYGVATGSDWGFVFARNRDFVPKHPTQLYEASAYFLCFVILLCYYLYTKRKPRNGVIFGAFSVLVFVSRLVIECWKEVQEAWEAGMLLNMGQILSLPFIAAGIVILVLAFLGKTGGTLDVSKLKLENKTKKK